MDYQRSRWCSGIMLTDVRTNKQWPSGKCLKCLKFDRVRGIWTGHCHPDFRGNEIQIRIGDRRDDKRRFLTH